MANFARNSELLDIEGLFKTTSTPASKQVGVKPFQYFIKSSNQDSHQADPYWLAVVLPFAFNDTYDRVLQQPATTTRLPTFVLNEIVIDSDCIQWSTSSSKESHVASLNMTLLPSEHDYSSKIAGEDWILFWAFNDFDSYNRVKKLVLNGQRANDFFSGLKFVGKVQNIFKNKFADPQTGRKTISYTLTAAGFSELDTTMYFDQRIELLLPSATVALANFSETETMFAKAQGGLITAKDAIPLMLSICLGTGPSQLSRNGGANTGGNKQSGNARSITPNEAYLVPDQVMSYLLPSNRKPFFKGGIGFTYVDLLKVFIGTATYTNSGFQPDVGTVSAFMSFGTRDISGVFSVPAVNFNMEPVWSILKTFLGEPMNEVYTCLRTSDEGNGEFILPTLVFRQLPFSSPEFCQNDIGTNYLTVPRWVISDSMVNTVNYGRSNALRCNYVHIVPTNFANTDINGKALAVSLSLPITDSFDIKRSGLRARNQTVGCVFDSTSVNATAKTAQFYNRLMADILFGGHLKYTGTISCRGIQEPICEGDNCVVDDIIFHIERVMHSGSIDGAGRKEFSTVLQVSNGVSIESDTKNSLVFPNNFAMDGSAGNTVE
jgi:hypothetical protein